MEKQEKNTNRIIAVSVTATLAVIVCLAVVFGSTALKTAFPKRYVNKALSKTAADVKIMNDMKPLPLELLKSSFDRTMEWGLKDFTSTDTVINESYMAPLKAMKLTYRTRRDVPGRRLDGELNLGPGSVPLLSARMFFSEAEMALNIPQGFDYYITAEPKSFVSEWDQSIYGQSVRMESILGKDFYRNYSELLFGPIEDEKDRSEGQTGWADLIHNAAYQYQGKAEVNTGDGMRKSDMYLVVIREEDAQAFWEEQYGGLLRKADALAGIVTSGKESAGFQSLKPVGDVKCTLSVYRGAVVMMDYEISFTTGNQTAQLSGSFSLLGQNKPTEVIAGTLDVQSASGGMNIQIHSEGERNNDGRFSDMTKIIVIQNDGERMDLDWQLEWDQRDYTRDNFHFSADMAADKGHMALHVGADGKVFEDREQQYAVWDIKDLQANFSSDAGELTAALALMYDIKGAETGEIEYERESAMAFNELSMLDLLEIINRLDRDVGLLP